MMTTFMISTDQGLIPSCRIARIETRGRSPRAPHHMYPQVAHYTDATGAPATATLTCPVSESDFMPVIPAAPGYEALQVVEPEGATHEAPSVRRSPIIAWRIDGPTAMPVTLDSFGECLDTGVLAPDGWVYGPAEGERIYSEKHWLQSMVARLKS